MKFTRTIMMLVLVSIILFSSIQTADGQTTEIDIDNSVLVPVPLLPAPDFLSPEGTINGIWTSSPFDLSRASPAVFHITELCRIANPSKFFGVFWYEWDRNFQIEIACWEKAKASRTIIILSQKEAVNLKLTKMGEAHARAIKLHKSERQVVAALGFYAAKQGAKAIVVHSFSNPVTRGDSAVLGGGGGAATDPRYVVNGAGGFGWTTSERVFRSFAVAELYR